MHHCLHARVTHVHYCSVSTLRCSWGPYTADVEEAPRGQLWRRQRCKQLQQLDLRSGKRASSQGGDGGDAERG